MAAPHRRLTMLHFLLLSSLLCLQARAESTGTVFFLDSPARQFLRSRSSDDAIEDGLIQLPEVGAAVSVLLGYAPSVALTASGSSKLNEVLSPNPFDRPRAVLMLEVSGVEDSKLVVDKNNELFDNAFKSRVNLGLSRAEIELPDEDEISVASLNDPLNLGPQDCTDKEISDFASWLGGSYAVNDMEPLNGELTIPLSTGASLDLHLSERADKEFTTGLVSLIHNIRRAIEKHEDLSRSLKSPAELLTGSFNGIKALQENHGPNGVADQGMTLLFTVLSKIFDSLQTAYKGEIVGVIICNTTPHPESEKMLNVLSTTHPSARWLEEKKSKAAGIIIVQTLMVRNILAWVTGILLLVATLLGVYFLLNMQLTRDTLLYSSVKLD